MLWIPMIITTIYLVTTILLFVCGPIAFNIHHPIEFYSFIGLYITSIIFGYVFGISATNHLHTKEVAKIKTVYRKVSIFWLFVIGAIVASSITLQLRSITELFNPRFWWDTIISGLLDPAARYVQKMEGWREAKSNKALHLLLFMVAPFKVVFVTALIMFWKNLRAYLRAIGLFVLFVVYLMPALMTGTNKPVFDLFIFAAISLFSIGLKNIWNKERKARHHFRIAIWLVVVLSIAAFGFFSMTTSARGGDSTYIETTSPLGDIRIRPEFKADDSRLGALYVWFVDYLVQGYYGLSLAMQEDFTSTYGFGSSIFISRQLQDLAGIDLASRTYQRKISPFWDENAQWHSFFSYMANDLTFYGVIIACFCVGTLLAMVWVTFIKQSNIWSFFMLPLLALMIVFIPANNQVFGFLESYSSFFFIFIGWLSSLKLIRNPVYVDS